MIKTIVIIIFNILSSNVFGQLDNVLKKNKDGIITHPRYFDYYQQDRFQLIDLQGDYTLAISYKETIANLKAALKIAQPHELEKIPDELARLFYNMHPADVRSNTQNFEQYNPYLTTDKITQLKLREKDELYLHELVGQNITIEGKKKPFRSNRILNMFKQVMYEEYKINQITPMLGDFHEFHPEFKVKYAKELPLFTIGFSKILLCLAKGVSSKFLFTEQEKHLLAWIFEQPYDSITIESIFRKGYQINRGNLYLTLMTIENILSYDWKSTKDNNREAREVTLRLKRIGHYIGNGDKFGHWYHFFGIMVYGLYKGRVTSQFVAEVESLGSLILSRFQNEKQENSINRLGAIIGARLRKVSNGTFIKQWQNQPEFLNEDYYLNEQKRERYQRKIKKLIKKKQV